MKISTALENMQYNAVELLTPAILGATALHSVLTAPHITPLQALLGTVTLICAASILDTTANDVFNDNSAPPRLTRQ